MINREGETMPPNNRARRLARAQLNLDTFTEQQKNFLTALKRQVGDVKEVCSDMLADDYTPQKALADMSSLWINGVSLVGAALYGRTIPGDAEEDDE
jgi:hypothetical protein